MRILFVTQKLDRDDDILGFVHGWVAAFEKKFGPMTVVCLECGDFDLPAGVSVFSLGKERGVGRWGYVKNLFSIVLRERKKYDLVFVHMNVEYVLLVGWLWRLMGKRVVLWYNHWYGDLRLWIARLFVNALCCTSKHAYIARFSNINFMPVGVDTDVFRSDTTIQVKPRSIIYVGRISPTKRLEVLISAVQKLHTAGVSFTLDIYGDAQKKDLTYYNNIRMQAAQLETVGAVSFKGSISNRLVPKVINEHVILVNLSPDGHFDKVIIEGIACERLVLVSNTMLIKELPTMCIFKQDDVDDMADKLRMLLDMTLEERKNVGKQMRLCVETNHSLRALVVALEKVFDRI